MASNASRAVGNRSVVLTWFLRILVVVYLGMLIAWPTGLVAQNTFRDGLDGMRNALSDPDVTHSLVLTVQVAVIAVLINLVFGVGMSLLLVRFNFPGKRALSALIDLPLSVSPIVVGLALVLVYNPRYGFFGQTLSDNGIDIVFATPGIVMATCFVALPLVVREVVPVLEEMGDDQEQAARSLGANSRQTFLRITLPGIRWAIVYGVVLSLARSLGEFGAVKIVAGKSIGDKETATLLVQREYQNFHQDVAYSVSFLLVVAAVLCLVVVAILRPSSSHSVKA
ncbi:sulfate ABC transporter permease [Nocardioides sp.]|uniref:sulfate ABC transporter permease n=1 Tax=Nocardioides sp. TaxID=35761 RepID=UPI00271E461E|nr:sulfate ABC transporter permease subunit [Nocardioides sp.]MDO9457768.1 sulfate ABC transporter permease subunit [Nocardioides sp.]